jgi:metallo-beta-lactamase class B
MKRLRCIASLAAAASMAGVAYAAHPPAWTAAREPFKIWGDTYYVGTQGLSAVLIVSPQGHLLVDATGDYAASLVAANIAKLGFDVRDVKAIVASHAHHDHAGGIAELVRLSGATVYARAAQAMTLRAGELQAGDPQHGVPDSSFPRVAGVTVVADDGVVAVGTIALHAIATAGHTPGGTSWAWRSCEGSRCIDVVYADSLTAVSADGFRFTDAPRLVEEFEAGIARLAALPCDVLVTPHPEQSRFFERMEKRAAGDVASVTDAEGCKRYADGARERLAARLQRERDGVEP